MSLEDGVIPFRLEGDNKHWLPTIKASDLFKIKGLLFCGIELYARFVLCLFLSLSGLNQGKLDKI